MQLRRRAKELVSPVHIGDYSRRIRRL